MLTVFCHRTNAGNSLRLLEDGLAGEHGGYRHGDQPGGSRQGGYPLAAASFPPRQPFIPPCVACTDVAGVRRLR